MSKLGFYIVLMLGGSVSAESLPEGSVPVVVSAIVGESIDRQEAEKFGVFKNIDNFVSATYFKSGDGKFYVELHSFDENGVEVVVINRVVDLGIEFVKKKIESETSTHSVEKPISTPSTVSPRPSFRAERRRNTGEKSVALAMVLSGLVLPGSGHWYTGETGRGWAFAGVYLGSAIVMFSGMEKANGDWVVTNDSSATIGAVGVIGTWVWALVDANRSANRVNEGGDWALSPYPSGLTLSYKF